MKIAIALETKDRRLVGGENYLGQTLKNLRRAGVFQSEHLHSLGIFSGGETPDTTFYYNEISEPLKGTTWHHLPFYITFAGDLKITRQQNAQRAIEGGATRLDLTGNVADWVLKLEDDLDFCDDFLGSVVRWLELWGHAQVPMFVLGQSFEFVSRSKYQVEGESVLGPGESFPRVRAAMRRGQQILPHAVGGWWGAQALLWKQPVAQALAEWLGPDPFLDDGREQHRERGHDLLLQVWGKSLGASHFACAVPSFVQHIGRQSNIGNGFFEFPWPGRDWRFL